MALVRQNAAAVNSLRSFRGNQDPRAALNPFRSRRAYQGIAAYKCPFPLLTFAYFRQQVHLKGKMGIMPNRLGSFPFTVLARLCFLLLINETRSHVQVEHNGWDDDSDGCSKPASIQTYGKSVFSRTKFRTHLACNYGSLRCVMFAKEVCGLHSFRPLVLIVTIGMEDHRLSKDYVRSSLILPRISS